VTRCKCGKRHRTAKTLLRCQHHTEWICGSGPIALLSCGWRKTITLHANLRLAEIERDALDGTGCGHLCHGYPQVIGFVNLEKQRLQTARNADCSL
jgi:hypothetical protein